MRPLIADLQGIDVDPQKFELALQALPVEIVADWLALHLADDARLFIGLFGGGVRVAEPFYRPALGDDEARGFARGDQQDFDLSGGRPAKGQRSDLTPLGGLRSRRPVFRPPATLAAWA